MVVVVVALKDSCKEEGVASELKGSYVAWLGQQEDAISCEVLESVGDVGGAGDGGQG